MTAAPSSPQVVDSLKRKLRQLKHLEAALRFRQRPRAPGQPLVWDRFFSTRLDRQAGVKYPLAALARFDRDALKTVIEEYFYQVYYQAYVENGLRPGDLYDPQLLALLGLPPQAGPAEIKQRFRALAKRYHPDAGGDAEQFMALMDVYEKLTET